MSKLKQFMPFKAEPRAEIRGKRTTSTRLHRLEQAEPRAAFKPEALTTGYSIRCRGLAGANQDRRQTSASAVSIDESRCGGEKIECRVKRPYRVSSCNSRAGGMMESDPPAHLVLF